MSQAAHTWTTRSVEETERLGESLGARLRAGDVVGLEGEMGAGKTALVRGIARGAGSPERVTSPTFTLIHRYEGGRVPLVHVDAYRLGSPEELVSLGLDEVLDPEAALVIEWPSRVLAALPAERLDLALSHVSKNRRRIAATAHGARAEALLSSIR